MDMLCYCVGQRHNVANGPPKGRLSLFHEGRALGSRDPVDFGEVLRGEEAVAATAGKIQGTSSASSSGSRGVASPGVREAGSDRGASRHHPSATPGSPAGLGVAAQDDDTDSEAESTLRDTSPLHRYAQSVKGAMSAQEAVVEDAPDLASTVVLAAGSARQVPKVGRVETLDAFLLASPRNGQAQMPSPSMAVASY
jgi:hypothetical protein